MPLWFQISEPGQGKLIVLLVLMRMPYIIALAVFLGWAYMKTNNIWLCVLIHGVNNAAGSAFDSDLVTVADTVESVSVFDGIMTAVAVMVMLLFLFTKEYRKGKEYESSWLCRKSLRVFKKHLSGRKIENNAAREEHRNGTVYSQKQCSGGVSGMRKMF